MQRYFIVVLQRYGFRYYAYTLKIFKHRVKQFKMSLNQETDHTAVRFAEIVLWWINVFL